MYYLHFTDKGTEAQRGFWTCPTLHSCMWQSFVSRTVSLQSLCSFYSPGRRVEKGPEFTVLLMPFRTPWGDIRTYLTGSVCHPRDPDAIFQWSSTEFRVSLGFWIFNLEESTEAESEGRFWGELVKVGKGLTQIRTKGQRDIRWKCWLGKRTGCIYTAREHLKGPLSRVCCGCKMPI